MMQQRENSLPCNDWSIREQRALHYVHRRFGHQPFLLELFLQEAPSETAPAEWHAGLVSLCRRGIVRMMRKSWGERLYHIPVSTYMAQIPDMYPQLVQLVDHIPDDERLLISDSWHRSMPEQVLALLLEIERGEARLTQKGQLHRKDMKRLFIALDPDQAAQVDGDVPIGLLEPLDLALRMGLALRADDRLRIAESSFARWLALEAAERERQMFQVWYRVHCPELSTLQRVTAAVRQLPAHIWAPLSALKQALELHDAGGRDQLEHWLNRLHVAGWVELAADEAGERYVRCKPMSGEEERTLVVQHDLEIIGLPNTPFRVMRQLAQFTERLASEGVHRYRITSSSVREACDRGWDGSSIVQALRSHALDDVPDHVATRILEWDAGRLAVRIVPGVLLFADSEQAQTALQMNEQQLHLQRLNDYYWLAAGSDEREIAKQVGKLDIRVAREEKLSGNSKQRSGRRIPDQTDALDEEHVSSEQLDLADDALHPQAPGLFRPRDASALYREERVSLDYEDVYPDYKLVPAGWYKQYRRYHPSTTRQLIEQAIRWRTGVRMFADADEYMFIPHRIAEQRGIWMIEGLCNSKPQQFRVDQIDRLQLLMPGLLSD